MKKFYCYYLLSFFLLLGIGLSVNAQTYTYTTAKSNADVGNPGGVKTSYDYTTTGATRIMRGHTGPNGSTSSTYQSTNYWSPAQAIPFSFDFYGASVDSFCVSKNGLLTFNTSVAGQAVNTNLNSNSSLPNSNLPDSTICYLWDNMGSTVSNYDYIYTFTQGSTGSRQLWILNYSWEYGSASYCYFAVVLEEGSNKIYVVDMSYIYGSLTATIGVQLSSSNAVQFTSGIHSTAGSPNIAYGSSQGSAPGNNEYYTLTPKLLVTDDIAVTGFANPSGAICATSDSVKVTVKNEGTNSITGFDIDWSVNGTSQSTYSHTRTLASGASTTVWLGNYTYGTANTYAFQAISSDPNGNTDNNAKNDTAAISLNKGLSGTYTVGTSSSDYATLAAAIADMQNSGVCGPVTFNIASGTYSGQVEIDGDVPGASSTNTITFKSSTGNPANVIITHASSSSTSRHTLLLNKTSFITFRDVTIQATGSSYGWAANVRTSDDIAFRNCIMQNNYAGTSSNYFNLLVNGSNSSYSTGAASHNITVDSCTFNKGGYASVGFYGPSSSSFSNGLRFTNNKIRGFKGYYGVFIYYQGAPRILGNDVELNSSGGSSGGLYFYYSKSTASDTFIIARNKIKYSDYYGIYMSQCDNNSTYRGYMVNNMIYDFKGTPTYYPIYNTSGDYWNIWHNTVDVRTSSTSTIRGLYITSANYTDVRNNIFSIQSSSSSGNHYAYYNSSSPGTTRVLDYNVYYNPNGTNLIYSGGARSASVLNTYSTSGDQNSKNIMPAFVSSTDAHLSDACFHKVNSINDVTTDIDGDMRNPATTHPGADHIFQNTDDIGVAEILSPMGTVSAGNQSVRVIVRNYGGNSVTGYTASYRYGTATPVSQTFATSLGSCADDTVTFTNTFSHTSGCGSVIGWTSSPGGNNDGNPSNDTSNAVSFGVPMSGTFTIGGTSGDFSTFSEAIEALQCTGVGGAVEFNVASGTYTEQLTLENIAGLSSTNTVTFQSASGNTTMPVLQFTAAGFSDNWVVLFKSISNIEFNGIHIKALNTSNYCRVITFEGSCSSVTIEGCKLEAQSVSTTSNYCAIIYDNTGTGNMSNNITIKDNDFLKGSYAVYNYGGSTSSLQSGWVITGNTCTGQYYYGFYNYYNTGLVVSNNKITGALYYGLYLRYCDGAMMVTGNEISGLISGYGIYMYYCDATSGSLALFANNTVHVGNGSSNSVRALGAWYSKYQRFYHNTFVTTSTNTSTSYAPAYLYFSSSTYAGNEFVNNVCANLGGGYAVYHYYSGTTKYYADLDYNVYYSTGSGSMIYAGGSYSSVSAYQTAKSAESNTVQTQPLFKSSSDLHIADGCYHKVPSLSAVTTDRDGETRSSSTHPGSDEAVTGTLDVGVTEILSPIGQVTTGNQPVRVVVKNFGSTTVTSLKVTYTVGTTSNTETFAVNLSSCTADTLTFTTGYNMAGGCQTISAATSEPNSSTDDETSNDAASPVSFGAPVSGGFTIGGSSGDFSTFNEAVDFLECTGVSGAVKFTVMPGTYNEQVEIGNINGASATNTITFVASSSGSMPVLTNSSSSASNFIVKFNGTKYITFDGIHMHATNSVYNRVVEFVSSNSYITIQNCKLESQVVSTSSSNSYVIWDYPGTGNMSNFITIKNNTILNGSYAIYNYGGSSSSTYLQDGWVITGNTITNWAYTGCYFYYNKNLNFSNNTVSSTSTYSTNLYGTYFRYCDQAMKIMSNKIIVDRGGYGMYMYYCDGSSSGRTVVANNYINCGNGTSWSRAAYCYSGSYQDWYNNTLVSHSSSSYSSSSTYATLYMYYFSSTSNFRNNIVCNNGSGYITYVYNPTYIKSDHNLFYSARTSSKYYMGGTYSTLAAYNTAKGTDGNSFEMNPMFSASPSYQPNQHTLYNAGDSTGITTDIDGNSRGATMSTIGAVEINPDLNVMSVAVSDTVCGTSNPAAVVSVTFKNEGDIDQQTARFNISVDGGTPVSESVAGPFAKGATYTRTFTTTVDLSGTTNSVVTVANADGDVDASDNSASTTVPYWAYPMSSFTTADSCLGDAMSFTSTSTVATTSIASTDWKFGDGSTGSGSTTSHTYASSGNYTVTIMSESDKGCRDTATQVVNVLTALNPGSIAGAQTICYGTTASLTSASTPSGSAGNYQYQWQSSSDNTTWSDISGATGSAYTTGTLTSSTYFRRTATTDIGCGPEYTSSVKVTVYDQLMASTISSDQTICYNTTPATITQSAAPTGGDGTFTYYWEMSTNGTTWNTVSGATSTSYSPGSLTTTTWYRQVSVGGSSCGEVTSSAVKISVYDDLMAGIVGTNHSVCPQSPANTISTTTGATGGDGTYTYQWQTSPNNSSWSDISGATNATLNSTTALTSTTYYRRKTTSGSSCGTKITNTVKVSIAPLPTSSFILANHCFNDVMPVTNNSSVTSGSLTGFLWDFGDGNTSTSRVPSYTYATSGVKTVKLKVTTNIGCVDSATEKVNVSNIPTPAYTTVYDCVNEQMLFKNATSVNCGKISAFAWDFGDGSTSTAQNPSHKYSTNGTYNIKFKILLPGGFADSVSGKVTIASKGVAGFSADDECFGDSVRFVNKSTNASSYSWYFDDKTSSTLENPVHFYRVAKSYDVTLVTTDGNSCNDTATQRVTVKVKPSVYFSKDDRCVNTNVPFNNGTLYAHTYSWTFGDGSSSTSAAKTLNHAYSSATTYTAKLVAYNNNGCRDSFSDQVTVYPNPTASFSIDDACTGENVKVTNSSTSNTKNHWDMGDGASTFTTTTPNFSYNKAGTFKVTYIAESINGCKDTTSNNVTIYNTPNADFTTTDVCLGSAMSFTDKTSGGSGTLTYAWDFGDGNSSSSQNPSHTYASAGKYTVTLKVTGAGGCESMKSMAVQVNSNPSGTLTVSDVCLGDVSNFAASTSKASTYKWSFGDGSITTSQTATHTYASAGTYDVVLTITSTSGCATEVKAKAVVNPYPVPTFTASKECLGTATDFTNNTTITGSNAVSYAWNFGDGNTSSATNPSHSYSSAGNYTVTLKATAAGCAKSYTTSVVVNDMPSPDFTAKDVCLGETTQFNNVSGGATKYSWDFGDGNSSTNASPSHKYAAAGNYTVVLTAENAAGCKSTKSMSVAVNTLPTADFSSTSACAGSSVQFTNNSSTGTYYWSFGDGQVGSSTNPAHTYSRSGTFTALLEVTDGNGCEASTSKPVTVFALPTASFDDVSGCENNGIQFNNTSGSGTYAWSFGDGNTSSATSPNHTYASSGTFNVKLTVTNSNNCEASVERAIKVNPEPTVTFTAPEACSGALTMFTNNSTSGANTWTFGDGASSRLASPRYLYGSAGTYSVKLSVTTAAGCTNSLTKNVTVNPNPTVTFTAKAECNGPSASFTNNSFINGGSISSTTWNYGDGNTGTANSHVYATSGVYSVTLTAQSDKNCSASQTKTVKVYNAPVSAFTTADVCAGDQAQMNNSSTNANSYAWDFGDGGSSTRVSPAHSYSSTGTFTISLTAKNVIGCESTSSQSIKVNAVPTANFTAPNACNGTVAQFTNTSTGFATSNWNFGDGNSSNAENPMHNFGQSGVKQVTLAVASSEGCTNSISKNVTVAASPVVSFAVSGGCVGEEVKFTNNTQNATTFAWSFGDATTSNASDPVHTFTGEGGFRVLLIASNGTCQDSADRLVSIHPIPSSSFAIDKAGREVTFTASDETQLKYDWNFDDGSTGVGSTVFHKFVDVNSGTFNVCLTVASKFGCESTTCNDVDVDLVGVDNVKANSSFAIYPNPSTGVFNVSVFNASSDISLKVRDAKGSLVDARITTMASGLSEVDITGVAEGVYFIEVSTPETTTVQSMVITR